MTLSCGRSHGAAPGRRRRSDGRLSEKTVSCHISGRLATQVFAVDQLLPEFLTKNFIDDPTLGRINAFCHLLAAAKGVAEDNSISAHTESPVASQLTLQSFDVPIPPLKAVQGRSNGFARTGRQAAQEVDHLISEFNLRPHRQRLKDGTLAFPRDVFGFGTWPLRRSGFRAFR